VGEEDLLGAGREEWTAEITPADSACQRRHGVSRCPCNFDRGATHQPWCFAEIPKGGPLEPDAVRTAEGSRVPWTAGHV